MKKSISLNAARAFIEAHFDELVTLTQLAGLSVLSVSRFATVFRQQYGSSPYRYLCGLRIQRAQTLLLKGVPGTVVATKVGFFDQSHFGRHFKRCCGTTPSIFVRRSATDSLRRALDGELRCDSRAAECTNVRQQNVRTESRVMPYPICAAPGPSAT
ncbi:AraC family transcriptional regulator [Paraburkholderia ginsengiterrae]|uniref:AraC family transcriptional regulator n=1 Tax=Paraburkholderia ginsengiterrae TaxID=1462993 RepID=A0A1A9N8P4_9BURK|nr:AraC family transcriptional regulator [Paraburkholderia ginsengiterrae]OAJ56046.1 AraC family transcriptional regulator [Paraburkholderia ginsengiterrae]OAJ61575.1 AraC family transcriptional regulator [Paraburkholderia ginsengiterrae]